MGQISEVADSKYRQQAIRSWNPDGQPTARIVLIHGLAEHSGRYERTAGLLADAGFEISAPDLFGFGMSGGRRGDIEEWSDYWDQIERLISSSDAPLVLMGHSMGGLISAGYVLSGRPQPQCAVLSAPAFGGGAWWQKAMAPLLAKIAPKAMIPNNLDGSQLSRDPAVGETYFSDPLVFTKTSARLGAALFAAQARVAAMTADWRVPTLLLHGGADTIVPPASTVGFGELGSVERRLYPKLRHEVYNEPEGPDLVGEVIDWITSQTVR